MCEEKRWKEQKEPNRAHKGETHPFPPRELPVEVQPARFKDRKKLSRSKTQQYTRK